MKGSCSMFLILGVLVGILFAFLSTEASNQQDVRDGGDAQVIKVAPPASGVNQQFAETYKTIAEGNKANAEGDAATTLANAQANQLNSSSWMGWIVIAVFMAGFLFVASKFTGG